jgi:hypothetical protein
MSRLKLLTTPQQPDGEKRVYLCARHAGDEVRSRPLADGETLTDARDDLGLECELCLDGVPFSDEPTSVRERLASWIGGRT